jgi:SAM-dependent MidA family methyltransferase
VSATPLGEKIRLLIEANGPMSVADYMALCLGDPKHGYYATRDPFGAAGDFVTAPEVSQMFGEIVGAWLVNAWRMAGAPTPALLVELGPGRGTLMKDILRIATKAQDFLAAARVRLVETSPVLKAEQAKTLAQAGAEIAWCDSVSELPSGPLFLIANEFFDALPVRQFVRADDVWRERVVGLDASAKLAFGLGAGTVAGASEATTATSPLRGRLDNVSDGSILELRPAADAIVAEIARRIAVGNGAALVIDYGYEGPAFGDTLQAIRGHNFADPLEAPGEADLTAHVDFSALVRAARSEGATAHGPISQGKFLTALGLRQRAAKLAASVREKERAEIEAAAERLAGPAAMGTLFKVLALTKPGIALPPFAPDGLTSRSGPA